MPKNNLNRFKVIVPGCPKPGCCPDTDPYIVDCRTGKIILQCMDEKTAEMACMALNLAQNEGLL